ncbi:UbiA family prenyltransferase [Streptomyces sp. NBC_01433]|uniref:UbiA family prenyltransferase n=1 Tax=Streptomyces sp. NBC_01433 TaxID=2903864 RepID=UPI00225960C3|nr:UbiA family prenyltransferase [Streptomyces sp. NBC_01433]MCX4680182.1 UbiA family prenyltransferase [Streptomyces sp. NBC_01433]
MPRGGRARAWAELLRVSALFTVPGDALAGAAAAGLRPNRRTALAVGASLCLYEAGMALNDWADREEDAVDRPHRPIPSGRIAPAAALGAAGALTIAGLALAARAGRPALLAASGLAATVWAYDLHLKHTKAGPAAMAAARGLDLLLGATATAGVPESVAGPARPTGPARPAAAPAPTAAVAVPTALPGRTSAAATAPLRTIGPPVHAGARTIVGAVAPRPLAAARAAVPAAALLGAHTYAITAVSRQEAQGGSTVAPLAALGATAAFGIAVAGGRRGSGGPPPVQGGAGAGEHLGGPLRTTALRAATFASTPDRLLLTALAAAYLRTAAPPLLHAALNPSPALTQRAVGGGIRAMIPLQAALAARAGAPGAGLVVMSLVPLARKLARKVSPT